MAQHNTNVHEDTSSKSYNVVIWLQAVSLTSDEVIK